MNGLGKQEVAEAGRGEDDEKVAKEMAQRLKDAADKAKDNANAKAFKPDPPSQVVGKGNAAEGQGERSVAGRKKIGGEKGSQEVVMEKEDEEETKEDLEVKAELNAILKKSPSMCLFPKYPSPAPPILFSFGTRLIYSLQ